VWLNHKLGVAVPSSSSISMCKQFSCLLRRDWAQNRTDSRACHWPQVHVRVKIPQKVGGDEKKLVEQLKTLEGSKEKAGRWF